MDKEIRSLAIRQYLKYFVVWFIALAVALVFLGVMKLGRKDAAGAGRTNHQAPKERVYDLADVLTAEEEENLRQYIAVCEDEARMDIVVVTINEDIEANGYWESSMYTRADDFYDFNSYGYDEVYGDGILLLDNYYEGQKGSVTSTCADVYRAFGDYENDRILDAVYEYIEDDPYLAYRAFVSESTKLMKQHRNPVAGNVLFLILVFLIPIIVAGIFIAVKLNPKKAKDTTVASTYVPGGQGKMYVSTDNFIRKNVVKTKIETSSSSGGGGGRTSRSGVRHGGGSRRR